MPEKKKYTIVLPSKRVMVGAIVIFGVGYYAGSSTWKYKAKFVGTMFNDLSTTIERMGLVDAVIENAKANPL